MESLVHKLRKLRIAYDRAQRQAISDNGTRQTSLTSYDLFKIFSLETCFLPRALLSRCIRSPNLTSVIFQRCNVMLKRNSCNLLPLSSLTSHTVEIQFQELKDNNQSTG